MNPAEYARMYDLEDTYWWFQGRKWIVVNVLEQIALSRDATFKVLDLGCGTGLMLDHLNQRYWATGLDFSPLALDFSRRRGAGNLIQGDVERLPVANDAFDLVTALDLMEHVEHDDQLLNEIFRSLKPGGSLLVTVPAHPFLWSDHDDALYHFRRYKRSELQKRILDAGFELQRLTYCITCTFPFIVAFRFLQRRLQKRDHPKAHLIVLPSWANRLLMWSVQMESQLLKWTNLPFGITLLAVGRKPQKP